MSEAPPRRAGGRILVDQLLVHGADLAFGVPGESYLAVIDALHDVRDRLRLIVCRHEAAAANAAGAYGRLTGRPGLCLVTRGPGATHASTGVHTAFQDSAPMILLIGQVARGHLEREAFQEIDYRRMFGQMAKWTAQVDDAARLPELMARAYHVATSGRPGPVVLALPEDMLVDPAAVPDAAPFRPHQAAPAAEDLDRVDGLLAGARRPLVVVGGAPWSQEAADDLRTWAERRRLPVAASFRRQDYCTHDSPSYVGEYGLGQNPALSRRLREADVLVAVGARLGENPTQGYTLVGIPRREGALVHVLPDPEELGRVYQPDVGIVAAPTRFLRAAAARPWDGPAPWEAWTADARADFLRWSEPSPRSLDGVDPATAVLALRDLLPDDAVITNGAGNYTVWAHRFGRFRRWGTQLGPVSGAMGYGLPAAMAAAAVRPGRPVVCWAGDGCFQMTSPELATLVQEDLPVLVVLVNNGMYGTIRMHQERHYPGRVMATALHNPDFAALARAHGAHGERVERDEDVRGALERGLAAGRPALVELVTDPAAITPATTIDALRAAALAGP